MSALMVVASGSKTNLRNRGIREFFLQPQGTYSVQELSRLWQLTKTEILDVIDSFKMEEIEPRKESRNEWIFSREDALAIASANCLFDGAEIGEALGRDAVPADWKNERLSLEVSLPHWMIQHFQAVCEQSGISPSQSVAAMVQELVNPYPVRDAAVASLLHECRSTASENKTPHPALKFPPLTLANATAFAEEALRELMGRLPDMQVAFPGIESQYGDSDEEITRISETLMPYEERFANILRASGIFESAIARATDSPDVLPGELADRVRKAIDSQQLTVAQSGVPGTSQLCERELLTAADDMMTRIDDTEVASEPLIPLLEAAGALPPYPNCDADTDDPANETVFLKRVEIVNQAYGRVRDYLLTSGALVSAMRNAIEFAAAEPEAI